MTIVDRYHARLGGVGGARQRAKKLRLSGASREARLLASTYQAVLELAFVDRAMGEQFSQLLDDVERHVDADQDGWPLLAAEEGHGLSDDD